MKNNILALVAAVIGGVAGTLGFLWIARQGFYALVLPGGLIGLGASMFKSKSIVVCVICGLLALLAGVIAEWKFAPFIKDRSFEYFLTHLHELKPFTLIMIAIGTVLGFWLPFQHRNDDIPVSQ